MDETIIDNALADITGKATVDESVAAYLTYPKAVRKVVYNRLPGDIKKKCRAAAEAQRGIAFRTQDGDIVLSRDGFMAEAKRLKEKHDAMDERKRVLAARMVELQAQAKLYHGDEFAAEVTALIA